MPYPNAGNYGGGSFPGQKLFYADGDFTTAVPVSVPKITFPFEGDSHAPIHQIAWLVRATNPSAFKYNLLPPDPFQSNENPQAFILEQRFRVASQWFTPLALDTPYDLFFWNDYQGALQLQNLILINESTTTEMDGGFVEWVRTYATIPPPRNTYESFTFTFPGVTPNLFGNGNNQDLTKLAGLAVLYDQGGNPVVSDVIARVEHKFFLVPGGIAPPSFSPDYVDPSSDFYVVPLFQPFFGTFFNKVPQVFDGSIQDFYDWTDQNGDAADPPIFCTIPPASADPANNADVGTPYDQMIGVAEVCCKASVIRPWRGNIYEKITLFTLAQ